MTDSVRVREAAGVVICIIALVALVGLALSSAGFWHFMGAFAVFAVAGEEAGNVFMLVVVVAAFIIFGWWQRDNVYGWVAFAMAVILPLAYLYTISPWAALVALVAIMGGPILIFLIVFVILAIMGVFIDTFF